MRVMNTAEVQETTGGVVVDFSIDIDGFINVDVRLTQDEAREGGGFILLTGQDTGRTQPV